MASSWELAHGKTGVIVTAGEAIASKGLEAVTITAAVDIPAEEVLPALAEILLPTGPARRAVIADPHVATLLAHKSRLAIVEPPIAAALTHKSSTAVSNPLLARTLTPRSRIAVLGDPLMVVVRLTAAAVNATRNCFIYGVATAANDLRPALIAGLTPEMSSDFEFTRQLLVAAPGGNGD
jgi:hypothetical protein